MLIHGVNPYRHPISSTHIVNPYRQPISSTHIVTPYRYPCVCHSEPKHLEVVLKLCGCREVYTSVARFGCHCHCWSFRVFFGPNNYSTFLISATTINQITFIILTPPYLIDKAYGSPPTHGLRLYTVLTDYVSMTLDRWFYTFVIIHILCNSK